MSFLLWPVAGPIGQGARQAALLQLQEAPERVQHREASPPRAAIALLGCSGARLHYVYMCSCLCVAVV